MKLTKTVLLFIIAFALGLGISVPSAQANYYKDVNYTYWAYNDINFLSKHKVINGFQNGMFQPGATIKRKDAAVMMVRALELKELGEQKVSLADMTITSPGYKEVEMALSRGWFTITEDNFYPDAVLTRDEMAKALATAFGYLGEGTSSFIDVPIQDYYYPFIDAILYHGVTEGYNDKTYRPLEKVTRAQFSAFLSRVFHQPIAYEIKVNGEIVETVQSLDKAIEHADYYEGSSVHPASHKFMSFSQEIANNDKTGIKAGALIYNGFGENDSFTSDFFKPYLSYRTPTGTSQTMFDTFIVLGLRYDGGQFAETALNKANYAEFQTQIDRTFASNGVLNNLNIAATSNNQKADVYIAIPYPKRTEDIVTLDGRSLTNDVYSRYDLTKWYIDQVMNEMQYNNYSNLNFKGFYWMNETVKVIEDEVLISSLASNIHQKDKFFIYAPHATSTNFKKWRDYGFDAAFLQPNAFRTTVPDKPARLHRAFVNAQIYGSGITMEINSYGTPEQAEQGVEAFNLYMDFAKRYDLPKKGMIFYQDRNMIYRMATFPYPVYQNWYKQLTETFFSVDPVEEEAAL